MVVRFGEVELNDVVLAVQWHQGQEPQQFDGIFTQLGKNRHKYIHDNGSSVYLYNDYDDMRIIVRRGDAADLARIPCTKCGKLLHPALSPEKGFTHGC